MLRAPRFWCALSAVLMMTALDVSAQDLTLIARTAAELTALKPAACAVTATPNMAQLKDVLDKDVMFLRLELPKLRAPAESQFAVVNRDAVTKSIDALGDATKSSCEAAAAYLVATAQPAAQAAQTSDTFSDRLINFGNVEASDTQSHGTTIAAKHVALDITSLGIVNCDEIGQCGNTASAVFTMENGGRSCAPFLVVGEHCDLNITFKPTKAGSYFARLVAVINGQTRSVDLLGTSSVTGIAKLNGDGSGGTNPSYRAVVGFDISAASSSNTEQKALLEFDLNAPIGGRRPLCKNQLGHFAKYDGGCPTGFDFALSDPLDRPFWWFFNPRITSLPQQSSALSALNIQGFSDFFGSQKTDLVQGVDLQGGAEWMFVKPRDGVPFFTSYKNAHARVAMGWVVGAGFSTPFSTPGNNPQVFSLSANSALRQQFQVIDPATGKPVPGPIPASFTNIAFVNRDRSRFFRKYYTGLRLKTYHFTDRAEGECATDIKPCEAVLGHFPGIIDLTVGQDEQVTGGHLSRWVFRLDAIYPLPIPGGFTIFGGINSAFQKNRSVRPLILPPTSSTALNDPSVAIIDVDPRNHDIYRLGLGIDLMELIKKATSAAKPAAAAAAKP